jgi:hypothetical protein
MQTAFDPLGRYPLYDPAWLRGLHQTCLWDGGPRRRGSEFCSAVCEERFREWEESMVSHALGREPLETLLELEVQ